jgi:hypothetical protein
MPWSRPLLAALAGAVAVLAAVSVSYGMLHPLAASSETYPPSTRLRDGRSERLYFALENRGPAAAHILDIALADGRGLRLRAQLGGEPSRAHPLRFKARAIEAGRRRQLYVELRYPACRRSGSELLVTLRALDVRLRVAGSTRTQRVVLDDPLRVSCHG